MFVFEHTPFSGVYSVLDLGYCFISFSKTISFMSFQSVSTHGINSNLMSPDRLLVGALVCVFFVLLHVFVHVFVSFSSSVV